MDLKNICKFWSLIKTHDLLVCNINKMMPRNGCSQMLHISLKTEKSFIAHPWCLQSVVDLEEYPAHDWRAATSVQRAPVTWREWGLWAEVLSQLGDSSTLQFMGSKSVTIVAASGVLVVASDVQCDSSLFLLEIVGSTKLLMPAGARTKTSVSLITQVAVLWWTPGPWFNIKMSSYQYMKSHCGDKTVVRSSYLYNGISYAGKMSSLYWIRSQHFPGSRHPTPDQSVYHARTQVWRTPLFADFGRKKYPLFKLNGGGVNEYCVCVCGGGGGGGGGGGVKWIRWHRSELLRWHQNLTVSRVRIYNALSMSSGEMVLDEILYLRHNRGYRTLTAKKRTDAIALSIPSIHTA